MGETVSEDREYTFVAKNQVRLKAVFTPKNVLHVDTYARVPFLITTHDVVSTPDRRFSYCGAIESFYPGEEIFVYAYFYSPIVRVELSRYYRFAWRISYNNTDREILSYSRQAYIKIPENAHTVYIKATFDRPNS